MLNKLIVISCLVFLQPFATAGESQSFSETLGWEKKWHKITSRSTEKYLSRIEKGPFAALSTNNKNAALAELRQSLDARLSWQAVGQDFSQGIIKHCDPETMDIMSRLSNRENVPDIDRNAVAKEYSTCAKKGFSESMYLLQKVIVESSADIKVILKKYS